MKATVSNLRDEVFGKHPDHRLLLCPVCGAEASAHKPDYFLLPDDYEFGCCNEPMLLVTKKTVFQVL